MCSILNDLVSCKINRNLTNIIREYLLLIRNKCSEIVNKQTYSSESTNIKSLYLYLNVKRNYEQQEILVWPSDYYINTIVISVKNKNILLRMNVYDFPYQDISKIKNQNTRNLLYNRKNWNNDGKYWINKY